MKTIADQIRDLEATRAAKAARAQEVLHKSMEESRSTDEAEAQEFDTLEAEIKQIDADLVRLRKAEQFAVQRGRPVVAPATGEDPAASASHQRGVGAPMILRKTTDAEDKFEGQSFTRMVIARALSHMDGMGRPAWAYAAERWGKTHPQLVEVMKAGVAGGGSGSGEWGAELVQADSRYTGDFITYLYAKTLFDTLPLKEVPEDVVIKGQDGAATANWVGESKGIPVSKPDYSTVSLSPLKVAAIAVVSNDLIRRSSPAAEALVRDALVQASAQEVDSTFFSASAASAGVSPAGILNGIAGHNSHGNTIDDVVADIKQLYDYFITANYSDSDRLAIITTPSLGKALSLMRTSLGVPAFPEVASGRLLGDPLYTGGNVSSGNVIVASLENIWRIGNLGIQVSISNVATIEQDGAPQGASDTPTAASATLMSMFQTESTAIKVVRPINFQLRRASAVALIDNAAYGTGTT
jgi:hypothetical protein